MIINGFYYLQNVHGLNKSLASNPLLTHDPMLNYLESTVYYPFSDGFEAGQLKEIGTIHWTSPNIGATNTSGFYALPGGYRSYYSGTFVQINAVAEWWSSTTNPTYPSFGFHYSLRFDSSKAKRFGDEKQFGFSIRCVRD